MFPRTQLNVSTEDNCTTNSEPPPSRPTSLGLDLDDSAKLGRVDTLKIDIGVRREGGNWLRVEHWARNTKQSRLFLPRAAATLKQRKHRVPSMSKLSTYSQRRCDSVFNPPDHTTFAVQGRNSPTSGFAPNMHRVEKKGLQKRGPLSIVCQTKVAAPDDKGLLHAINLHEKGCAQDLSKITPRPCFA